MAWRLDIHHHIHLPLLENIGADINRKLDSIMATEAQNLEILSDIKTKLDETATEFRTKLDEMAVLVANAGNTGPAFDEKMVELQGLAGALANIVPNAPAP